MGPLMPLVQDATAAGPSCPTRSWHIVSTTVVQQINPGSVASYDLQVVDDGIAGGFYPIIQMGRANVAISTTAAPYFTVQPVSTNPALGNDRSTLKFPTRSDAVPGVYTIRISGADSCGSRSSALPPVVTLIINPALPVLPPITPATTVDSVVQSVLPLCINVGVSFTIVGNNFQAGATVTVGTQPATQVTPGVPPTQTLVATYPAGLPNLGKLNLTVTNPDGTTATLLNAVTLAPCGDTRGGEFGGPGGGTTKQDCLSNCKPPCTASCENTNCLSNCSQPSCVTGCHMPTCLDRCDTPACTSDCGSPVCAQHCTSSGCTTTCVLSACSNDCKEPACTKDCESSTRCVTACNPPAACTDNCRQSDPGPAPPGRTFGGIGVGQTGSLGGARTGPVANPCPDVGGDTANHYHTIITIQWSEPLIVPMFSGNSTPYVTLSAKQDAFCQ
jgi:hypothetical protein